FERVHEWLHVRVQRGEEPRDLYVEQVCACGHERAASDRQHTNHELFPALSAEHDMPRTFLLEEGGVDPDLRLEEPLRACEHLVRLECGAVFLMDATALLVHVARSGRRPRSCRVSAAPRH